MQVWLMILLMVFGIGWGSTQLAPSAGDTQQVQAMDGNTGNPPPPPQ